MAILTRKEVKERFPGHLAKFDRLASRLSPENLSCDGGLSEAEQNVRIIEIMVEWKRVEREIGNKVFPIEYF